MKMTWITPAALGLALLAGTAQAATPEDGKKLHERHCVSCHDSKVYTRADRLVQSLTGLKERIRMCESSNSLHWNDKQISAVAAYLNTEFYKFGK